MDLVINGLNEAFWLLVQLDPDVLAVTWLSVKVSGLATLIALLIGIPLGTWLALGRFPGRHLAIALVHTGMGLPPVVVGLAVSICLWRTGPLGFLNLLYSPTAIIIAQVVIAFPVAAGLTRAALSQIDPGIRLQTLALGATRWQVIWVLYREVKLPLLATVMAAFGAVISEVGAVMMVGGNIKGYTRVLTTATVTETRRGNFSVAIALGAILLGVTFLVNLVLTRVQERGMIPR